MTDSIECFRNIKKIQGKPEFLITDKNHKLKIQGIVQ